MTLVLNENIIDHISKLAQELTGKKVMSVLPVQIRLADGVTLEARNQIYYFAQFQLAVPVFSTVAVAEAGGGIAFGYTDLTAVFREFNSSWYYSNGKNYNLVNDNYYFFDSVTNVSTNFGGVGGQAILIGFKVQVQ